MGTRMSADVYWVDEVWRLANIIQGRDLTNILVSVLILNAG